MLLLKLTEHLSDESVQILAYADDVDIVAKSKVALTEAFFALENAASKIGLRSNNRKNQIHASSPKERKRECSSSVASKSW
jgi:rRNA maturation endonuclease Nob1